MIDYKAQAASAYINGEATLRIGENSLTVMALFDAAEIPFAEINSISFANYIIRLDTDNGIFNFSRLGNLGESFFDSLRGAYNKAVLRSMFISGKPQLTASGVYRYIEKGSNGGNTAPIHVYDNCITALPLDLTARRVPLCFANNVEKGAFEYTIKLDTGESYSFAKLGYETDNFASAVENNIRKIREKSINAVKEICPSLSMTQAMQLAKIMPLGTAAPLGQISAIAPVFTAALEEKLSVTRAAGSYSVFKELCDPAKIYIGFRKDETFEEDVPPDPYLLWLIAPSPDNQYAAVEFAEADSATFIYRTGGDFNDFAWQLARALEAISFRREVIRLSDEELRKPENADYYMAVKRTAALRFIRANFAARIIHSSAESWKRKLTEIWNRA